MARVEVKVFLEKNLEFLHRFLVDRWELRELEM